MRLSSRQWLSAAFLLAAAAACSARSTRPPNPGAPAALLVVSGDGQDGAPGLPLSDSVVVQLVDSAGGGVPGLAVQWSVQGGGGTVGPALDTTDAAGFARAGWILGSSGANQLLVQSAGISTSFSATALDQVLELATQPGAGAEPGVAFVIQPVVQLAGPSGTPIMQAGVTVTATIHAGAAGATLSGQQSITTSAGGTATFTDLAITGPVGSYTLQFSAPGFAPVVSTPIALTSAAAPQLQVTRQPSVKVNSGSVLPVQPKVQLLDATGVALARAGVTVSAAIGSGPAGGSLGGSAQATTGASGVAAFSGLVITGPSGQYTLRLSASGFTSANTTSIQVTSGVVPAIQILRQPSNAVETGIPFPVQPRVQLLDDTGEPFTTAGIQIVASIGTGPGGASLGGQTAALTSSSGTAVFSGLQITGPAGDYTLHFATAGFTPANSATVSVSTSAVAQLSMSRQPSDTVTSGAAFAVQPKVQLLDGSGQPLAQSGVIVSAVVDSGPVGGALTGPTTATSNSSGIATFSGLALTGPGGTYVLQMDAPGFYSVETSPVTIAGGTSGMLPLIDLGGGLYLNRYPGGLYPGGSNTLPSAHAAAAATRAGRIKPRNTSGNISAGGKFVLLSLGMSNATQEWCSQDAVPPCDPWTFMGQAESDGTLNRSSMVILNGARASQTADHWISPDLPAYNWIRDSVLGARGLTEKQVEVLWVMDADPNPSVSLPSSQADAYTLEGYLGDIVRALRIRYPNLEMIFFSSRIYGGYAVNTLNPEPYAYESGFAVKWLIQAQIKQMSGGTITDPVAGDLNYNNGTAPWIGWAAYTWADGTHPRSDGLVWVRNDFETDGTHPSQSGETKVGTMLIDFFKTDPHTSCWFLAGQVCP